MKGPFRPETAGTNARDAPCERVVWSLPTAGRCADFPWASTAPADSLLMAHEFVISRIACPSSHGLPPASVKPAAPDGHFAIHPSRSAGPISTKKLARDGGNFGANEKAD